MLLASPDEYFFPRSIFIAMVHLNPIHVQISTLKSRDCHSERRNLFSYCFVKRSCHYLARNLFDPQFPLRLAYHSEIAHLIRRFLFFGQSIPFLIRDLAIAAERTHQEIVRAFGNVRSLIQIPDHLRQNFFSVLEDETMR